MTREEFINEINNNKYYSLNDVQISDAKLVDTVSYICNNRYSIATDVYELEDGYAGIRGVVNCVPSHTYKDVDILCTAFPMKKISIYVKE